jgi:hypothetical protein
MAKIVCTVDTDAGTISVNLDGKDIPNVNYAKFRLEDEIDIETGNTEVDVEIRCCNDSGMDDMSYSKLSKSSKLAKSIGNFLRGPKC